MKANNSHDCVFEEFLYTQSLDNDIENVGIS